MSSLLPSGTRLTVAIATYNGRELLPIVLRSLAEQTFRDFRVVVVDDASTDDTPAWLAAHWPGVEVIVHPENRGVTATLNAGLLACEGEYVALLNNDIELDPSCLAELVAALDAHPNAAVAAPKMLGFHDRRTLDGAGDVFEWRGVSNRRAQGLRDDGQFDDPRPIFGACAGAALYRHAALQDIGLLDEDFFAYQEDVDWSFRAQLRGYECRYVPSAVVYHVGGATLGKELSDFTLYQNWRNGLYIVIKDYPLSALLRHGHSVARLQVENLLWSLRVRRAPIFVRVWRDVLRHRHELLRKRARIQRSRTVGLRELERAIRADA